MQKNLGNNNISTTNDIIYTPVSFPSNTPLQENHLITLQLLFVFSCCLQNRLIFFFRWVQQLITQLFSTASLSLYPTPKGKTYHCHDQIHSIEWSFSLLCLTVLTLCLPFQLNHRNFKGSSLTQVNGHSPRSVLRLLEATIPKSLRIFFISRGQSSKALVWKNEGFQPSLNYKLPC